MSDEKIKINLGGGRLVKSGYTNIDIVQFVDGNGKEVVDIVMDVEKDPLPFDDSSVHEILADNVLEHFANLKFTLNECHRVLKEDGFIEGVVPVAGTDVAWRDPTHVRFFVKSTFGYFTGSNPAKPDRPSHPKYADYGYLPWNQLELKEENDLIYFKMSPRKV